MAEPPPDRAKCQEVRTASIAGRGPGMYNEEWPHDGSRDLDAR